MKGERKAAGFTLRCLLSAFIFFAAVTPVKAAAPIYGFADLHNHQFANLGFGGKMFSGAPFSNSAGGIADALPWCTESHGAAGVADPVGIYLGQGLGHLVGGWPQFDGWPRWSSVTHQQVYYEWLYRAFQGGLKLMVMHAVNSKALCELYGTAPGFTCNDMDAADRQINGAYALQDYIDNMSGGPGLGWYRIVTSPAQARQVIDSGKLAVVLGIEVDNLFNCGVGSGCTPDYVASELDRYYNKGVRHIFPVHLLNNGFGGPALYDNMFNHANKRETGYFFAPYDCSPAYGFQLEGLGTNVNTFLSLLSNGALLPPYQGGAHCNQAGLTQLGISLIQSLMDRKMIIDIDHLSLSALNQTLDLVEPRDYPVVSGHTGLLDISLGMNRTEARKSNEVLARIKGIGGLVGTILSQGGRNQITTAPGSPVANDCGHSSRSWAQAYLFSVQRMGGAVAIGTDFNGLVQQPAPRFGGDACSGDKDGLQDEATRITYPFTAQTGVSMDKSQMGGRPYIDIFNPEVPPRVFDYNVEGLAHVGMLPDFIEDLKRVGLTAADLEPLFGSAEAYIHLWEKIEAPNLKVFSLDIPASAVIGQTFEVVDITRSTGSVQASVTRYYLSPDSVFTGNDTTIGERSVLPLDNMASDATTTVTVPANTAVGNYYVIACADAAGAVFESNEKDNCRVSDNMVHVDVAKELDPALGSCFKDDDNDGYRTYRPNAPLICSIAGSIPSGSLDCNDSNASVHPGAVEICNGRDDNCNGQVDEGVTTTYYADADGDGYGDPDVSVQACAQPAGHVLDNTDCNDRNTAIHPKSAEACNGKDDNCNGQKDEGLPLFTYYHDADGDGYGDPDQTLQACMLPAGYAEKAAVKPLANAGPDQFVHAGGKVILDGKGSSDPDGNYPLNYSWTISAKPQGSKAELTDPGRAVTALLADLPGTYTVTLVVVDAVKLVSSPDEVSVSTYNTPPTVSGGGPYNVYLGSSVTLTATGSDADGDALTYAWDLDNNGSFETVGQSAVFPTSGFSGAGSHAVNVRVTDGLGGVGTATATVTVVNGQPRISGAIAGKGVQSQEPGQKVLYLDLRLTDTGTGNARNLSLKQITPRTLAGTGSVTYNTALSPSLPLTVGSLDVGEAKTFRLYFTVPSTVTRFSITESGTVQDVLGVNFSYSIGQSVIP